MYHNFSSKDLCLQLTLEEDEIHGPVIQYLSIFLRNHVVNQLQSILKSKDFLHPTKITRKAIRKIQVTTLVRVAYADPCFRITSAASQVEF